MDFLDKLGVDWKLFGAQLINFAVLLFILRRYLYGPIVKLLEKRRKEIENNAEKTKLLDARMKEVESEVKNQLKMAEQKAQSILSESRNLAEKARQEAISSAEVEAQKIINSARKQMEKEQKVALESVRVESLSLVRDGVFQILRTIMDGELKSALQKKALDAVESLEKSKK